MSRLLLLVCRTLSAVIDNPSHHPARRYVIYVTAYSADQSARFAAVSMWNIRLDLTIPGNHTRYEAEKPSVGIPYLQAIMERPGQARLSVRRW